MIASLLYDMIGPGMLVKPRRVARREEVELGDRSVVRSVAKSDKREGNELVSGQLPAATAS